MRKRNNFISVFTMFLAIGFAIIFSRPVKATANGVQLKANRTYTAYDVTGDGMKDKIALFCNVKKEFENISVICTSPSKTFNLAGMLISNIFIPDRTLRKKFRHQVDAAGISQLSPLGHAAVKAAYVNGEEWYNGVIEYIRNNRKYVKEYTEKNLPGVKVIDGEGTYLTWLDFRGTGIDYEELDRRIIYEAKLWLDSGKIFGASGQDFQRINLAAPRKIIEECMERLKGIVSR